MWKRTKNLLEKTAHNRYASVVLFVVSVIESIFFPVPPDVLLIPLAFFRKAKAFFYAHITTIGSVIGGVIGYALGFWLYSEVAGFFSPELLQKAKSWFDTYGLAVLFIAAFTPVPYKVFTINAGFLGLDLIGFIAVSLVGRGLRFYLIAAIMRFMPELSIDKVKLLTKKLGWWGLWVTGAALLVWGLVSFL